MTKAIKEVKQKLRALRSKRREVRKDLAMVRATGKVTALGTLHRLEAELLGQIWEQEALLTLSQPNLTTKEAIAATIDALRSLPPHQCHEIVLAIADHAGVAVSAGSLRIVATHD